VNYIDNRLRRGKPAGSEDSLEPTTTGQETV